jgi:hypothetical protein
VICPSPCHPFTYHLPEFESLLEYTIIPSLSIKSSLKSPYYVGSLGQHRFPKGLNDCFSGLEWLYGQKESRGISNIVVSGESGGGNLSLALCLKAKNEGKLFLINGVYAFCPYIFGDYGSEESVILNPSLAVCANKYILEWMYIDNYICIFIYIHMFMYTFKSLYIYICIYTNIYIHKYIYIFFLYIYTYTYMYIYTYIYIYIYIYKYIYT